MSQDGRSAVIPPAPVELAKAPAAPVDLSDDEQELAELAALREKVAAGERKLAGRKAKKDAETLAAIDAEYNPAITAAELAAGPAVKECIAKHDAEMAALEERQSAELAVALADVTAAKAVRAAALKAAGLTPETPKAKRGRY